MKEVRVVPVKDPAIDKVPPFHFLLSDPSGKSLVIEYRGGEPVFYDNPVGVITNNPTFDWHLQNLRNYGYLQIDPLETKKWGATSRSHPWPQALASWDFTETTPHPPGSSGPWC